MKISVHITLCVFDLYNFVYNGNSGTVHRQEPTVTELNPVTPSHHTFREYQNCD